MLEKVDAGFQLSPQQMRFWSLDGGSAVTPFRASLVVLIDGPLIEERLREAIVRAIRRHEILRTTFHIHSGLNVPVQVVSDCDEFAYEIYDLSGLEPQQVETGAETITREMGRRPYDLAQGPLLRVALITSSPNKRALHISLPALCADAPALGELFKEIVAYYDAAEAPETKGEAMQYADLAEAFNELLNADESGAGRDYWRGQIVRTATRLPFRRRGGGSLPFEPQVLSRRVPGGLMTRIIRLSELFDVAPAMALLSCWEVLLWRWTAETEVITGVVHNGRDYEELDSALGLIARCARLRIQLAGGESFADTLRRVNRAFQEGAMRQEHFRHADAAEGDRSGSLTYFPVCFEMTELPPDLRAGGVSFSVVEARSYVDRFDVKLSCVRREEVCAVELHYNGAMFRQEVAGSLIEQLLTLVESVIENPDATLDDLNLLSQAEWRRRLIDDNDTIHPFPAGKCLHHLIEEQARRSPDSIALNFENEAVSYAELVERADSLARIFRVLGVGPEKPVAVCAERSPEMVVGLLAVLKAGGFYAPLEPEQPKERLAFILKDVQPAVLLTQARLLELLPEHQAQVVLLDTLPSETGASPNDIFTNDVTDANLAYAIYTSGSTGRPKGVMIPHRAIVNRLLWGQSAYHLTGEDKVLQSAAIGFDFSVWEIFGALMAGAQLVLPQPEGQRDSFYLGRLIAEREVTAAHFVPSMLRLFLKQPGVEMCHSLRYVFSGGEALSVELQDHFFAKLEAELYNQYGPTEASVDVTFWRCKRGDEEQTVPIGRPISNTQVYALDRQLRPLPCGAPGELYIGGANIARGYLNRPDLTAARFIPHPFSDAPGARLYGTGDRARVRTDGSLEFLGRIDRQVKIRGARVESGEVEAALRAHPAVKEAVISARETPSGGKALVAYLVTHDQTSLRKGGLLDHLRTLLPDYMLPGAFVFLKAIPSLTSGKVDYQALPPPSEDALAQAEFVGARGPAEEILSEIWAGLLGLERVGGSDNFFELGGHSLLATQLASKIRAVFRVEMPLRRLFGLPTVAGMGEEIRRLRRAGDPPQAPPINRVSVSSLSGVSGPPPLSFAQQRLWFLDQLEPGTPRYNCPAAARLTGRLDVSLLRRCFDEIIRRHEVLRTTFRREGGYPAQIIASEMSMPLPAHDLSALPESERELEATRITQAEFQSPFDLERGPLLRATLLRLSESEHIALITMHHIVSDGWSVEVFLREFGALYAAYSTNGRAALPELPIQYADYALWQRGWLHGDELERLLNYWRRQLHDAPRGLNLPTDRPRPALQSFRGGSHNFTVSADVVSALRELGRREGATMFMTLLAAWVTLLWRYSRQTDICVGAPVANRTHAEIENLIGFFTNTLALRADVSGDPTFVQLLGRIREVALDAYERQDAPFEKVVEALQPERDLSRTPLFQVMFAFRQEPHTALNLPGLTVRLMPVATTSARFDITLNMVEEEQGLWGSLEYSADLFDPVTIENMSSHFRHLLAGIAARPNYNLSEFAILSEAEQRRLLANAMDFDSASPPYPTLHEWFEKLAGRIPHASAVTFGEETLSYGELNSQANRLARRLRELGVRRETLVALCLEPATEMIVAILGVLKAGAAYVPLNPNYPEERLSYVLTDTLAPVLITISTLAERIPWRSARTILLDAEADSIAHQSDQNLPSLATSENLAYVIYTSGSAGRPKGVMVTHANALRLFSAEDRPFDFDSGDVWTLFHSYAFDFSVWELWGALLHGGRLVVIPREVTRSPDDCWELLSREGVTVLNQTPSSFRQLAHAEELLPANAPIHLRYIIFGGEALDAASVQRWFERRGDEKPRLVNMYGITETTVHVTSRRLRREDFIGAAQRPIGGPLPGWEIYLLDERLRPLPSGVPGEIFVGGAGVARGYLNRPDLTAERFAPHPFSAREGARLYRSGDLARRLPDGDIEYLGRIDQQVKIRGFRIEPAEVAVALMRHPAVREAVVLPREDAAGDKRLVAYIAPRPSAATSGAEMRSFLKERLPEYMLPSAFVLLESLPLTANGKLDLRSLPPIEEARPNTGVAYAAPSTDAQRLIADVWREVLRVERVGTQDNFFDLGGHSLSIVEAHNRLRETYTLLSVVDLFKYPTVAALAEYLEGERDDIPALAQQAQDRAASRRDAVRQMAEAGHKRQRR